MADREEQRRMVDACIAREARMTELERGFIDACDRELFVGRTLTFAQTQELQDIWRRVNG